MKKNQKNTIKHNKKFVLDQNGVRTVVDDGVDGGTLRRSRWSCMAQSQRLHSTFAFSHYEFTTWIVSITFYVDSFHFFFFFECFFLTF